MHGRNPKAQYVMHGNPCFHNDPSCLTPPMTQVASPRHVTAVQCVAAAAIATAASVLGCGRRAGGWDQGPRCKAFLATQQGAPPACVGREIYSPQT